VFLASPFCPYFVLVFLREKRSKTNAKVAEVRTTVLWAKNQKVEALRNELFQWPIFLLKKKDQKQMTTVSPKMTIVV
jgi:hypothetical protein